MNEYSKFRNLLSHSIFVVSLKNCMIILFFRSVAITINEIFPHSDCLTNPPSFFMSVTLSALSDLFDLLFKSVMILGSVTCLPTTSPSVRRSVSLSQFPKRPGSYISMLLYRSTCSWCVCNCFWTSPNLFLTFGLLD